VSSFCEVQAAPRATFAPQSFRWIRSGKARVLIGCPKGEWKRNRCAVGTRAYKVLVPTKGTCSGRIIVK